MVRGLDGSGERQKTDWGVSPLGLMSSVPEAVLPVLEKMEGNSVHVSWGPHPSEQHGGCITHYTIYLERSSRERQNCKKHKSEVYQLVWCSV